MQNSLNLHLVLNLPFQKQSLIADTRVISAIESVLQQQNCSNQILDPVSGNKLTFLSLAAFASGIWSKIPKLPTIGPLTQEVPIWVQIQIQYACFDFQYRQSHKHLYQISLAQA